MRRVVLDSEQLSFTVRAHDDYGVTLVQQLDGTFDVGAASTQALREELHNSRGFVPFFDRGPGYRQLSGRDYAEVDVF